MLIFVAVNVKCLFSLSAFNIFSFSPSFQKLDVFRTFVQFHVSCSCARRLLNFLNLFITFIKFFKIAAMIYLHIFCFSLSFLFFGDFNYMYIRPLNVFWSSVMLCLFMSTYEMTKAVRVFVSVFEPNWWQLPGSKISKDWENAPENGSFAPYFTHVNQRRMYTEGW